MSSKSSSSAIIDAVVTALFFVFIYRIISSHVPSNNPKMVMFFGVSAAACMTGVFWLAWQMVKVVYRFQKAGRSQGE